jgi:hypothetical protein
LALWRQRAAVHSLNLPRNSTTSNERRRHLRHRLQPFSTIVVELGPDNGGNLINIGGGGLSLQAVAKLVPDTELTLRFQLQGMDQPIEATGRVTWVGPTRKVAGISFKNLPDTAEQQIVDWVESRDQSAPNDPSSDSDNSPPLPSATHGNKESESDPSPPPLPEFSISVQGAGRPERLVLPLHKSLESLSQHPKPILQTITLSKTAAALSPRRSLSLDPSLISVPAEANSAANLAGRRAPDSSASKSRWPRWKIAIAVVAAAIGILALLVVASNYGRL